MRVYKEDTVPTVVVCGENPNDANGPAIRLLEGRGFDVRVVDDVLFGQGNRSDEEEIECLEGANATVAWGERYPAAVIEALPDLKVIARMGVGFDKVDLKSASERGVVVTVTPNANHEAVAEHALAFIMSLAKLIVIGNKRMREGEWPSGPGKPLRGSTLGIVGLGRIGRSLAVRAVAMRMRVIATELYPDREFVAEHGIELVDLDTLLGSSDYVSLHCPLNDETRGFINKTTLESMNPNGVLINTARGGLVVERDLLEALKSGQIAGAGLDVFEEEPTDPHNPLYELDNVIVSAHVAGNDELSLVEMGLEAAQNIVDLYDGKWPGGSVVNNRDLEGRWSW